MISAPRFIRLLLLGVALMATGVTWAQSYLVGVNTRTPTENLHVNGTFRVGTLPTTGTTQVLYYSSNTPSGTFTENMLLVADANGVLGRSAGAIEFFFYMPPIMLPLHDYAASTDEKSVAGVFSIDLYQHYTKQFGMADATSSACSPSGTTSSGKLPVRPVGRLRFYVTYYDETVFENIQISDQGVLSYKVKNATPTDRTFVNVIFGVK